jgi:NADPH2:quinone reductase
MEGAGVEAVGEGVTHLKVGDRAAYASQPPGSYCEVRVMPAKCVCKLPDAISFETGAAMMLKGLTAQYLLKKTLPVEGLQPGDYVLFHAAAGGVGLIACQWAKALGLQLIGTAGSDEKCALALANGAAHAINYRTEDFAARVKDITGGQGVKVVYDSVGKDTWDKSLDCLRPFGLMASFGNASGPVPPFAPGHAGCQGLDVRHAPDPVQPHHHARGTQAMADDLFAVVLSGPGEDPHRPALSAGAGAGGAPRPGGAPDHRLHHPDAVTQPPSIATITIANYDHFAMGCGHFRHQMMPKTPAGRSQAAPGAGFSAPGAPAAARPGSARLRPR